MEGSLRGQYVEEGGGVVLDGKGNDVEVKVMEWEDFQEALAHMCGLGLLIKKARVKKEGLFLELEAAIEVRKSASHRADALEAMQRQLQEKLLRLKIAQEALQARKQDLARVTEFYLPSKKALHVAFKVLADAQGRLQVADALLAGDGGHGRLQRLHNLLDSRRRKMVAQVASLYPLTSVNSQSKPTEVGGERGTSTKETLSLAIAGMQLLEPGLKLPGHVKDKPYNDTSATALGYVSHVVSLVARYLDVQLRYPIRPMASRSYIQDYSPAIEPPAVDVVTAAVAPQFGLQKSLVEFPLFSEGQDATRSAYGVFLLNKDLEQILNHLGYESVGPRHTLLNLERLLTGVLSQK